MTLYKLPNHSTFTKTTLERGQGLHAPNEGSPCKIIVRIASDASVLEGNAYHDLLPFDEEITVRLGFYSSLVGNYVHKCLLTMKPNELCTLNFEHAFDASAPRRLELTVRLISFERAPEIYSLSLDDLYDFALRHKENANRFFHDKHHPQAFELYHRSLSYVLNFVNEQPSDECLERFNQLILSIYANMSACQLAHGNNAGVIENCSSALTINPQFVKALFRRGCAYANLNDYELALRDLQFASELEPNDRKIDELLKSTRLRFEQYKKTLGQSLKNLF